MEPSRKPGYSTHSRWVYIGYFTEVVKPLFVDYSKGGWDKEKKVETLTVFVPEVILYRDRSKYKPHQGKKEVARRLRNIRHRGNNPQEG